MATTATLKQTHFQQAPMAPEQPQARAAGNLPNQPLSVLPVEGDGRRFYVMSRRPEVGWLAVFIGDATHCPTCECEHHRFRLVGTRKFCAHLQAADQYRRSHSLSCPCCGEPMTTSLDYREGKGYVLAAVCSHVQCRHRTVL